jgi:hypothetical protein
MDIENYGLQSREKLQNSELFKDAVPTADVFDGKMKVSDE